MENTGQISLPIFAGENYEFWCKKMKTLLASLDLWELVDEGFDDEDEDLTMDQLKELKKLKQRDAAALSKIQQAVADSIFPRIMGAEKSKEAWEILQKEFGGVEKEMWEANGIEEVCTNLREKYSKVSIEESESCIYRVHTHLRNVNPKAYEPEIVSIGPYHHGKEGLKVMEDHKLRYLHILDRENETILDTYVSKVAELEAKARKCYAEPISLKPREFVEMLVLDGCFIIELVRKLFPKVFSGDDELRQMNDPIFCMEWPLEIDPIFCMEWPLQNDPIFCMEWPLVSLQRDLMLFENQIPFFILQELFNLINIPNQHITLMSLLLIFFSGIFPGKPNIDIRQVRPQYEIKHLLHLIHCIWLPQSKEEEEDTSVFNNSGTGQHLLHLIHCIWLPQSKEKEEDTSVFNNSVTGLREANVTFKKDKERPLFDIKFEKGTMHMAALEVQDTTEAFFRNLIAYEQYANGEFSPVTDYMNILDYLINSSKDVQILSRLEIVRNRLGDDEAVAKMVNGLGDQVVLPNSNSIYTKIYSDVNKHCRKRRNKWMAKLRRNYLHSPWAIISIVAAVLLLLLTVAQTVFSILQFV